MTKDINMLQAFLDSSSVLLALIIGLAVFKKLNSFYKLLFLQVLLCVFVNVAAVGVQLMKYPSVWVYNLFMPVETILLLFAAQTYFKSHRSKKVLTLLFGVFGIVYFIDLYFVPKLSPFAYHAAIMEGVLISGVYLTILYFCFMKKSSIIKYDVVVASIGIIFYFLGTEPFLSMVFYLEKQNTGSTDNIFQWTITPLAHVRYLFIAIAFIIAANSQKQSPSLSN